MEKFTHLDEKGKAKMVDVTRKKPTRRVARARGCVIMKNETLQRILERGGIEKGEVLNTARIAGIQAAKFTSHLIPLCHPLNLTNVEINFTSDPCLPGILIDAEVKLVGVTGAEMEALTAVSISALTIYDMCKAVDKDMVISEIKLMEKRGGKSGTYKRK